MARDRSNYNRKPPQAQFPTGLPYGKAQALEQQAATQMPGPRPTPPSMPPGPQAQPASQQPMSLDAAIAGMSRMPPVTPLNAPTQHPGEPLMAGVNAGAGPGSEVLPQFARQDRSLDVFYALAEATGDQAFAQLAELARGR